MNNLQLDEFLDNLEEKIQQDAYNAYGAKGYDRWLNPRFCHTIDTPDATASLTGECGDTMIMSIRVETDSRIADAAYRTDGCASSSICGSFAAELAIGKSFDEVLDMTGETILNELGTFPREEQHCAHLAITTVKEAIHIYMRRTVNNCERKDKSSLPLEPRISGE